MYNWQKLNFVIFCNKNKLDLKKILLTITKTLKWSLHLWSPFLALFWHPKVLSNCLSFTRSHVHLHTNVVCWRQGAAHPFYRKSRRGMLNQPLSKINILSHTLFCTWIQFTFVLDTSLFCIGLQLLLFPFFQPKYSRHFVIIHFTLFTHCQRCNSCLSPVFHPV